MTENEGRLRAVLAEMRAYGLNTDEKRVVEKALPIIERMVLDHAIEQIRARRAKRLHVKALEGFDEALAVLAGMRGEDG